MGKIPASGQRVVGKGRNRLTTEERVDSSGGHPLEWAWRFQTDSGASDQKEVLGGGNIRAPGAA